MPNPAWVRGVSGNPQGRPLKKRALTELLFAAGARRIDNVDGLAMPARKLLAQRLWDAMMDGRVMLGDAYLSIDSFGQWFDLVKWVYAQIDGPVPPAPPLPELERKFADDLLEKVAAHAYDDQTAPV